VLRRLGVTFLEFVIDVAFVARRHEVAGHVWI